MDRFPREAANDGPRSIRVDGARARADVCRRRFQTFQSIAVLDRAAKIVQGIQRRRLATAIMAETGVPRWTG